MRSKILISTSLRNYFCASLSSLPSIPHLKDYLTQPFENKIPIESHCYKKWKQEIGDMVDNHFINGDVARVTGRQLSYKCQTALGQQYSGSENSLLSRYDRLLRDIWDFLRQVSIWLGLDY